jgi:hypothetical protein
MEEFIDSMRSGVLPDCFNIAALEYQFKNEEEFLSTVSDSGRFLSFIEEQRGIPCTGCYTDVFQSGFLGSYAFALWFMEFDENNWYPFEAVQKETLKYLNSNISVAARRELRLLKGNFKPMNLDLPVVVDYGNMSVTVWTGELND